MQTQNGKRWARTALTLLGVVTLVGGGLTASNAQSGGSMNGGAMGGRQGSGRGMKRQSRGKDSGKVSGGLSDAMSGKALMDDTSGFANFYTGLDKDNQMNLREVYQENIDRLYPNDEDPVFIMPAPWNYPAAAPGAIDSYHYADYTTDRLVEGSTYDAYVRKARLAAAREKAFMRRAMQLRMQLGKTPGGAMSGGMRSGGM